MGNDCLQFNTVGKNNEAAGSCASMLAAPKVCMIYEHWSHQIIHIYDCKPTRPVSQASYISLNFWWPEIKKNSILPTCILIIRT